MAGVDVDWAGAADAQEKALKQMDGGLAPWPISLQQQRRGLDQVGLSLWQGHR